MSEQEFCLLHGYEFMEKRSANPFNEYDLCTKCEEERAVQAPADRDADAVRSPEDERTLGETCRDAWEKATYSIERDCTSQAAWEAAATAVRDKVMEWKTIETAPKDGTWIWAFYSSKNHPQDEQTPARWQDDGYNGPMWWDATERWGENGEQPTHWMPLPSPPCVPDRSQTP